MQSWTARRLAVSSIDRLDDSRGCYPAWRRTLKSPVTSNPLP